MPFLGGGRLEAARERRRKALGSVGEALKDYREKKEKKRKELKETVPDMHEKVKASGDKLFGKKKKKSDPQKTAISAARRVERLLGG